MKPASKIIFFLLIASSVLVYARAEGITFPVAELGNCADKDACRVYCDDTAHMQVCIQFAKDHGLMSKDEADKADKYRRTLEIKAGPGGCQSPTECRAFCSDSANLETCLNFAKDQGIKDKNVDTAGKMLAFIKSGGQTPGNCGSKESCVSYCKDFSHAEECLAFSKKIGGEPPKLDKFIEAVKNGAAPGGCKTKDECEVYCKDNAHREECISFAVKAGIFTDAEAGKIRQEGGRGPGGCDSQKSCASYCNSEAHHDECFKFAEDHGLVTKEESQTTKDGLVSIRAGLDQVPSEVKSCIRATLGDNVVGQIQSGKLVPSSDIAGAAKSCFEKFGKQGTTQELFKDTPAPVLACLKEKLGLDFEKIKSGKTQPTPAMADAFRICFEKVKMEMKPATGAAGAAPAQPPMDAVRHFIQTAPPDILPCIKEALGSDYEKILSGEAVTINTAKLKICFEKFRPMNVPQQSGTMPAGSSGAPTTNTMPIMPKPSIQTNPQMPSATTMPAINFAQYPPIVVECIKAKIIKEYATPQNFLSQPDATSKFESYAKDCLSIAPPPLPAPSGVGAPTSSVGATNCPQILTPARDPATGYCKVFVTPCNIPLSWVRVERCDTSGSSSTTTTPPPTVCAPVSCPYPPTGCKYENTLFNSNKCLISCGTIVCNTPPPTTMPPTTSFVPASEAYASVFGPFIPILELIFR